MLTLDLEIRNMHKYNEQLVEKTRESFDEVYELYWSWIEGDRVHNPDVPPIEEMLQYVYSDLMTNERIELVDAGVHRKDHEIFGYDLEEYTTLALSGKIEDEALVPNVRFPDVSDIVYEYAYTHQIFFSQNGALVNVPISEVW